MVDPIIRQPNENGRPRKLVGACLSQARRNRPVESKIRLQNAPEHAASSQ